MINWQEVTPRIGPVFYLMKVNGVTIGQINADLGNLKGWVGAMRLPSVNSIRINHSSVDNIKNKMESIYEEWVEMMGLKHIDARKG